MAHGFSALYPRHGVNSPWPRCKLQKASRAIFHAFIKLNDHSVQYTEKDLSLCHPLSAALSCVKSVLFFRAPLCSRFSPRIQFFRSVFRSSLMCVCVCVCVHLPEARAWIIKSRAEFRQESENGRDAANSERAEGHFVVAPAVCFNARRCFRSRALSTLKVRQGLK
jgi:hypothetical protein